jgi:adenylate kinase
MFILLGLPGSGKSVQADLFKERQGIHHIAPGISLRKIANETNNIQLQNLLQQGSLVDDEMVASIIQQAIAMTNGEDFMIEGYPRTMDQITKHKDILQKDGKFFIKKVIILDIGPEVIINRLMSRKVCHQCHKSFQNDCVQCSQCKIPLTTRSDDNYDAILNRIKVQGDFLKQIIDYLESQGLSVVFVKGDQSMEQVYGDILKVIETA